MIRELYIVVLVIFRLQLPQFWQ